MSKHNDTINALKRLERAGDQSSQTNAKLVAAAKTLLAKINAELLRFLPAGEVLPESTWHIPLDVAAEHGLAVARGNGMSATPSFGYHLNVYGSGIGSLVSIYPDNIERKLAIAIGEAVAGGLMQSLAKWAESRINANLEAASAMTKIMSA